MGKERMCFCVSLARTWVVIFAASALLVVRFDSNFCYDFYFCCHYVASVVVAEHRQGCGSSVDLLFGVET